MTLAPGPVETHTDDSYARTPPTPTRTSPETNEDASRSAEFGIKRYHRKQDKKGRRLNYAADFETTTDPGDCRVWGWGLCAIPDDWASLGLDNVELGKSLQDFLAEVTQLGNAVIYFHNLKFDGSFILDYLLRLGYEYNDERKSLPGTFKTLISSSGQFYTLTVSWENGYTTEFRDSVKKLPMSVAEVAKAFPFEMDGHDLGKGDLDYRLERPIGWDITPEEAEYIKRDVLIIARALGQQFKVGLTKLTVGADALTEFRTLTGKKQYDSFFPTFSYELDAEIRRAYRGAFTYADPRFTGRVVRGGKVYDNNSMYPYIMYDRPMPYGMPQRFEGYQEPTPHRPLTIFSITFTAKLKPNHIPCIQIKGNSRFMPTEYLTRVKEPTTLMVTNVDYELMRDHYDLDVHEFGGGWAFTAANGIFDAYIEKWMKVKEHSTGGMRSLSKLQLTSLYGKFATNPDVTGKYPTLEDEVVRLKLGKPEHRDPVYTPVGVFITSYGRDFIVRLAQQNYDTFAYCDTDSLHLLTDDVPNLDIHDTRLGAWKHELDFTAAYYIRAKGYLEYGRDPRKPDDPLSYHNAIAGVPTYMSGALTFDDLVPGTTISVRKKNASTEHEVTRSTGEPHGTVMMHGKLTPHRYPGGIVLEDTPFELKLGEH